MTTWQRLQQGWPATYPLVQFPNAPLLAAFAAWIVAALTEGSVHDYARGGFYVGLAAWAWLELSDGANLARRVIGAGGLVYAAAQIGSAIGS